MQVAHSYQIDAEIENGWYWQESEGCELHGPFETEQDAELAMTENATIIDYNEGADRFLYNLSDAKLRGQLKSKHCNSTYAKRVQAEIDRRKAEH